ncbi:MAG: cell division protein FtsZ [Fibrobacteria bacterium]|nr:cell division protein FtsZ [Fibrobacteria bacterium]
MNFSIETPQENGPASIKVVGVGGAGGNAVNRMVEAGLTGVEFISVNTDLQVLETNLAQIKVQIGSRATRGLGAGANPEVGRASVEESHEEVAERLKGADMVFITAGMGGGTGTGAAPVVAEIARELGILTVAIVTRPFDWEGGVRKRNARQGLEALRGCVDSMIVIPNQKLLSVATKTTTMQDAFRLADEVLYNAIRGITSMILRRGSINMDFADVSAVMRDSGQALMGAGAASGENRARMAAEQALHAPLLDSVDIHGATGMLVHFSGSNILLAEIDEVMGYFREALGEEKQENIIFGLAEDPDSDDEFRVTLIATGFDPDMASLPPTGGNPTYRGDANHNAWREPAPVHGQAAPAPQVWEPVAGRQVVSAPTGRSWQVKEDTASVAARSGTGTIPVAATRSGRTLPVPAGTREPSGHAPVAPVSHRSRSEFVPDYQDYDDTDTPAFIRLGQ